VKLPAIIGPQCTLLAFTGVPEMLQVAAFEAKPVPTTVMEEWVRKELVLFPMEGVSVIEGRNLKVAVPLSIPQVRDMVTDPPEAGEGPEPTTWK
jgi:hypothetical protein